jgi:hemerythrin-like domain-containing protein
MAALRALYDELQALEADMHQHLHLENNVLFPRAARLECERHSVSAGKSACVDSKSRRVAS